MIDISASQIEAYKDCPRKWGYRSLDKIRKPQGPGAAYGSELHDALEKYIKTRELPEEKDFRTLILKAANQGFLPDRQTRTLVERAFELSAPIINTFNLVGKIDCVVEKEPFGIIDHKYTSDLRYAKDEKGLEENIQAIIYSYAAFRMFHLPEFKGPIFNRWIYYHASGKTRPKKVGKVIKVEIEVDRETAEKRFDHIYQTYIIDMIKAHKEIGGAKGLEQNFKSCQMYGGCPYMNICKPNTKQRFSALIHQKGERKMVESKLMEKLKKQYGEKPKEEPKKEKRVSRFSQKKKEETKTTVTGKDGSVAQVTTRKDLKKLQKEKGAKGVNPEPVKKQAKITVLFGCVAAKGSFENSVHLIELLTPLLQDITKSSGAEHWANIPLYELKPQLAASLEEWFEENDFNGVIIVQNRTMESDAVREVLLRYADLVIQGVY